MCALDYSSEVPGEQGAHSIIAYQYINYIYVPPGPRSTAFKLLPICPGALPTLFVFPIPSWPSKFDPQQTTSPLLNSAQVWNSPIAMPTALRPVSGAQGSNISSGLSQYLKGSTAKMFQASRSDCFEL